MFRICSILLKGGHETYSVLLKNLFLTGSLRNLKEREIILSSLSCRGRKGVFDLSTWKAWTSNIVEWMSSSLVYLWDQLTVTLVWNTGETGDINYLQNEVTSYQEINNRLSFLRCWKRKSIDDQDSHEVHHVTFGRVVR